MPDMNIAGTVRWDQRWFQCETLTFGPGSVLLFTRQAIEQGGGRVVLLARKIVCDQANPGTITCERSQFLPNRDLGKAPNGQGHLASGDYEGGGAEGGAGATGLSGDPAKTVPTLH